MARTTGVYQISNAGGEEGGPSCRIPCRRAIRLSSWKGRWRPRWPRATLRLGRLAVAAAMVPSAEWFLYGFVRKEAVISSQIEGTQATLHDVLSYEATEKTDRPDDVLEICNYVEALAFARKEIRRPKGLPLSSRLLCAVHKRLMKGVRGAEKQPGEIRTSQNWIGGTRPGNAVYVPPPPQFVPEALSDLDRWLHSDDPLAPLLRAGLSHVQFETIHPFLDGNGRIGRLLIALLVEHWGLLPAPLLYLSLAFMRHRGILPPAVGGANRWRLGRLVGFLLGMRSTGRRRRRGDGSATLRAAESGPTDAAPAWAATIPAIRLFDQLPNHPMLTMQTAVELLGTTKPTAAKAVAALQQANILRETTGKQRDRVYAYHEYLQVLTKDTE